MGPGPFTMLTVCEWAAPCPRPVVVSVRPTGDINRRARVSKKTTNEYRVAAAAAVELPWWMGRRSPSSATFVATPANSAASADRRSRSSPHMSCPTTRSGFDSIPSLAIWFIQCVYLISMVVIMLDSIWAGWGGGEEERFGWRWAASVFPRLWRVRC